jgi:two-component system sensor histidine kinase KdpD
VNLWKQKHGKKFLKFSPIKCITLHQVPLQYSHPAPQGFKSKKVILTTRSKIKRVTSLNGLMIIVRQLDTEQIIFLQRGYYIPLKTHRMILGLMAFAFEQPEIVLTPENKEIFETMAFLGALALERV